MERTERFKEVLALRTRYLTVVMEDVFQLHNTSAVIRSCDVFGIQDLHLIQGKYGERLDKNIAMGAHQWVNLFPYKSASHCVKQLEAKGYTIVATSPDHPEAVPLEDFKISGKTALCFGTEKEGLSPGLIRKADHLIKIPMVGFTQSLNISVAVAIVLHELSQQLRRSSIPWGLSENEQLNLRLQWTKSSIKSIDEILSRLEHNA